jgi:hypothetical protein
MSGLGPGGVRTRLSQAAAQSRMVRILETGINVRASIPTPQGYCMFRKTAFAVVLSFTASIFVQVIAISQADAGSTCTYVVGQEEGLQVLKHEGIIPLRE